MPNSKGKTIRAKELDKKAILDELSRIFKHVEREAIVHLLIETMFRNKFQIGKEFDGKKIGETISILAEEGKMHFMLVSFPADCLNELETMEKEGMLKIKKDRKGTWKAFTVLPETVLAQVVGKFIGKEEATSSAINR